MKECCKGGGGRQLRNPPSIPSYVIQAKLSFFGKGKREHKVRTKGNGLQSHVLPEPEMMNLA
jgi:hypothetical protein